MTSVDSFAEFQNASFFLQPLKYKKQKYCCKALELFGFFERMY